MATFYRYDVVELGQTNQEYGAEVIGFYNFPKVEDYPYDDGSFEKQFFYALGQSEIFSGIYDGSAEDIYKKSIELGFRVKVSDVVYTDSLYVKAKIELWYPTEEIYNTFINYLNSKNSFFSTTEPIDVPTTKFNVELNRPHPTPVPA